MAVELKLTGGVDSKGRPLFKLLHDYEYVLGPSCEIVVPEGYVTNFGTIPKWFYPIVSPTQLQEAAIVHDYLCGETFHGAADVYSGFSRVVADAVLKDALVRMGTLSWWRIELVYRAVRLAAMFQRQGRWRTEIPQKMELK